MCLAGRVQDSILSPTLGITEIIIQCHKKHCSIKFILLLFSHSVTSNSLQPHRLKHTGFPVLHHLPELAKTHVHWHRWCYPTISSSVILFSSCLQSFPASGFFLISELFASAGQKFCSFSFSIIPSKEIPGLLSFRMDWLDLLAVQGTLKGLLQHHSSKASVVQCSA